VVDYTLSPFAAEQVTAIYDYSLENWGEALKNGNLGIFAVLHQQQNQGDRLAEALKIPFG